MYSVYLIKLTSRKTSQSFYKVGYSVNNAEYRLTYNDKVAERQDGKLSIRTLFEDNILEEIVVDTEDEAKKLESDILDIIRNNFKAHCLSSKDPSRRFSGINETFILSTRQLSEVKSWFKVANETHYVIEQQQKELEEHFERARVAHQKMMDNRPQKVLDNLARQTRRMKSHDYRKGSLMYKLSKATYDDNGQLIVKRPLHN